MAQKRQLGPIRTGFLRPEDPVPPGVKVLWRPHEKQIEALLRPEVEILYGGAKGGGKGLPLTELVLTPFGFKPIGEISVADQVTAADGSVARVIGVYPRGKQGTWKLTFIDGASVTVDSDHLWFGWFTGTCYKAERFVLTPEGDWQEIRGKLHTTEQVLHRFGQTGPGKIGNFIIPLCKPVPFTLTERWGGRCPVDAYLLGLLLGDGCLRSGRVMLASADHEIVQWVADQGFQLSHDDVNHRFQVTPAERVLVEALASLGLMEKLSHEKFVPEQYRLADVETRTAVLAGLMDSDGYVDGRGHIYFTSTSKQLAEDVQWLARSLGAKATLTFGGAGKYRDLDGDVVTCKDTWDVYIQLDEPRRIFRLSRKRDRCRDDFNGGISQRGRRLMSIEPAGEQETVCIKIDHPSGLFITNDFIVTHNTACGIAWLVSGNPASDMALAADHSYMNHPYYRALVLRRNMIDMGDWIDKARRVFEPLGAVFKERPLPFFEFRSGAKIILGHLDDSDTYAKYQGQEFQRFLLEEATLVPDFLSYMMVKSCIRSVYPELRAQIFLTANPGGPGHCLAFGDVLTPGGWVDIRKMKVGDAVFTVDSTRRLVEVVVEQVHKSRYSGDMVRATARGFHMECTPNHGVAKVGGGRGVDRKRAFTVVPFEDLPGQATVLRSAWWLGDPEEQGDVEIPRLPGRRKHAQPLKMKARDYGALMGWFISEGSLVDRDKAFSIAQTKVAGRRKIANLLERCGFTFSEGEVQFTVYSPEWHAHLKGLGLGHCTEKFLPGELKQANYVVLRYLFDALVDGDGHWTKSSGGNGVYYTSSSLLADDVAEVAIKCGYMVYQASRQRGGRKTRAYEVNFKTTKSRGTELLTGQHVYDVKTKTDRRSDVERVPYDGYVYCIGVPDTHTFVIRQNGCVWISGNSWVRDRFVKPKDEKGRVIAPNTTITDPVTGLTRIYVPAKLKDNPTLLADPNYQKQLQQLPEAQRRAFLDGDWDALSGVYFTEFRPTGPLVGEPAEAQHVIAARPLEPWLRRHIGMDWGYAHEGAAYWGCEASDGRFHVYREMVEKNLGAEKWGAEVALRSLDDLRGVEGGTMSLYLSPDAWDKRNETRTIADQIADGVRFVLGPDSVYQMGGEESDDAFFARLEEQRRFGIAIRKAPNQRIAGAAYLRSMLRWWPLTKMDAQQQFDEDMFIRLMKVDPKRAMEYRAAFQRRDTAEVLPGMLIHDCCGRLIDCIQSVLHDEKNPEDVEKRDGDDCYDAWRYLTFARTKERVREPESVFVERRMAAMARAHGGALDGNTKVWVARKAEEDYRGAAAPGIFNVPRLSSRRGMEFWRN